MKDIRPVDPDVRELGRRIAALERTIRDQASADQADARAITDGSMDVYDDDGDLRGILGKQPDGGYAFKAFGKKPATPAEPDVIPVPGGCVVEWDGSFDEAQTDDVQRVAIHVGLTEDFEIVTGEEEDDSDGDSTERAAILSPRGGSAFLALDPGEDSYWIRLTAIAEGGAESDPSDAVEATVASAEAAFWQDTVVLTGAGDLTFELTYEPIDNSDHLYWNGLYQREDIAWTRIGQTVTLTGEPFGVRAGDVVTVEYAFLVGEAEARRIGFEASGWRYLVTSEGDATSRSGSGFDDSGWDVGRGAFGNLVAEDATEWGEGGLGWPAPHTVIGPPVDVAVWIRRSMADAPADIALTLSSRVDGDATYWWNGTLLGTRSSDGTTNVADFAITEAMRGGDDVLAIKLVDDASDPAFDFIYIDAQIRW